jgi:hypothetical protein
MSPEDKGVEFDPAEVEFEPVGAPPDEAGGCWGVPEACPEGAEGAAGCAVEPEGAGVKPTLEAIAESGARQDEGKGGTAQKDQRSREKLSLYSQTSRKAHNL